MSELGHQAQVTALYLQHSAELREWANEAVDAVSHALFVCEPVPTSSEHTDTPAGLREAKMRLSAAVDKGRFFLTNEGAGVHGAGKPTAYRGFRPQALDYLVAAYRLLQRLPDTPEAQQQDLFSEIWHTRKLFVSELQDILSPQDRSAELEQLLLAPTTKHVAV